MSGYRDLFDASINDPATFWADAAKDVTWTKPPQRILDDGNPPFYRWFPPDAELNTCANALDRHVESGRAEQPALIYDSAVTDTKRTYTYAELLDHTARFAGALRDLGVGKGGDRVVIYMPMIPRSRHRHAGVRPAGRGSFGGVRRVRAPHELAVRIDDVRPAVIVSASCGIEPSRVIEYKPMLDGAIAMSSHPPPRHCVVVQRDRLRCDLIEGRDLDWEDVLASATPADAVPVAATDPLYVLYTSGTTGKPKGIVRDNGGHAVALMWSMRHIYDIAPGDVFWAASDVGWVVGHSYIVYAPLLLGATTVLYEGKPVGTPPDPGAFWRVAAEHGVKALFTAPTAIRAIRKEDPEGKYLAEYDLSGLKYLFLAGERLDPTPTTGLPRSSASPPSSTTGGRPRPGGRSPPIPWAPNNFHSSQARPPSRCRDTTCTSCTTTGTDATSGRRVRSAFGCPCRRAHCPRCGMPRTGFRRPTCPSTRAST